MSDGVTVRCCICGGSFRTTKSFLAGKGEVDLGHDYHQSFSGGPHEITVKSFVRAADGDICHKCAGVFMTIAGKRIQRDAGRLNNSSIGDDGVMIKGDI